MRNQARRLEKLKKFYLSRRRMPSLGELAGLFGFRSKNAAKYLAAHWIGEGVLDKDAAGRLLPGRSFRPLKVLGTVKAGFPSPAAEASADTLSLDDWLIDDKEASFMLKVSDDLMAAAGIMSGDSVILARGRQARNGDIVLAGSDRTWAIEYFKRLSGAAPFRRASRKDHPMISKEEPRIAGVVTAVIRKYH